MYPVDQCCNVFSSLSCQTWMNAWCAMAAVNRGARIRRAGSAAAVGTASRCLKTSGRAKASDKIKI